jgi:Stage II sporulation protein E (SpoIIE)
LRESLPVYFPKLTMTTLQLDPRGFLTVLHGWLTDARNTQQAEFEAEGLQQVCGSHAEKSLLELLGHIFSTIQRFMGDCPQFDDMTPLAPRWASFPRLQRFVPTGHLT